MTDAPATGIVEWVDRVPTGTGPLDGVRIGVKEIVAIDQHPVTANTPLRLPRDVVFPGGDAPLIARLRAAGGRVVATTTSHELAWGITTHARGRQVVNPSLPGRIAGGSSGGSAVAVAQGTVDLGVATDTAGSARIPAAWCDVFGWKASDRLVPMDGIVPLAPGLDHVGLIARSSEELSAAAMALGAAPAVIDRVSQVRVSGVDPRAAQAVDEALAALAGLGLRSNPESAELTALFGSDVTQLFAIVQGAAALHAHRDLLGTWPAQAERYAPEMSTRLRSAERRSAEEIEQVRQVQGELRRTLSENLTWSVLVLPATGCPPPTVDDPDATVIDGERVPLRSVVLPWTVPANLAGLPAVTVPWVVDGEPVGVQLMGAPGSDLALLRLAGEVARQRERMDDTADHSGDDSSAS